MQSTIAVQGQVQIPAVRMRTPLKLSAGAQPHAEYSVSVSKRGQEPRSAAAGQALDLRSLARYNTADDNEAGMLIMHRHRQNEETGEEFLTVADAYAVEIERQNRRV